MPYLKIQTNQALEATATKNFIKKASELVAEKLGKPERYVMVVMDPPVPMVFAGSDEPTIFMELKSIGLSETQTPGLSDALCHLVNSELGIAGDRVYIEFADAPRKMWGWNGATF